MRAGPVERCRGLQRNGRARGRGRVGAIARGRALTRGMHQPKKVCSTMAETGKAKGKAAAGGGGRYMHEVFAEPVEKAPGAEEAGLKGKKGRTP